MFGGGRRDWSVDVLRCISCFMVCALHASWMTMPAIYGLVEPGSFDWVSGAAYRVIFGSPTVLFVMVSGIFFLSPERHVTAGKIWRKNVLKMTFAYIFWCLVYALYRIYFQSPQPIDLTPQILITQWLHQERHLWYIPMIIGLYILVPILRPITASRDTKMFRYLIIIFAGGLVLNTIYTWPEFPYGENYIFKALEKTPMELMCQYLFWMLYGWIAYTYRPCKKFRYFIYTVGIIMAVLGFCISLFNWEYAGDPDASTITRKFTIITFCKNTALFYFIVTVLREHEFSKVGKAILGKLSSCTLMIYLIHWLFLSIMMDHGFLYSSGMSPWIAVWIYAAIAYVCGGICGVIVQAVWKPFKKLFSGSSGKPRETGKTPDAGKTLDTEKTPDTKPESDRKETQETK